MRLSPLFLFFVLLLMSPSCASVDSGGHCSGGDPVAIEEWEKYRNLLAADVVGESSEEVEAQRFFRRLAGVEVRFDWGYVGGVRYKGTIQDLRELDSWFERNCRQLFWDEGEGLVILSSEY